MHPKESRAISALDALARTLPLKHGDRSWKMFFKQVPLRSPRAPPSSRVLSPHDERTSNYSMRGSGRSRTLPVESFQFERSSFEPQTALCCVIDGGRREIEVRVE